MFVLVIKYVVATCSTIHIGYHEVFLILAIVSFLQEPRVMAKLQEEVTKSSPIWLYFIFYKESLSFILV